MNKVIKDIIGKECSNKEKLLDLLSDEIKIARGVLSGEYKYCFGCDDYYLAKSYLSDTETKDTKICMSINIPLIVAEVITLRDM